MKGVSMKSIKTITCHDVYNHGASLQAYALQRYLISQGYNNEIIDYKPPYLSGHHKLWTISNPLWEKNILRRIVYLMLKLPGRLIALKRKREFDHFKTRYLRLTSKRYTNNTELKMDCPDGDIYIAGSDQIWNTMFENGKDAAFYLDFVPKGKKRISYAASIATEKIQTGYENFVKEKVKSIDFVSVRETSGVKLLIAMGIENVYNVIDPVFLLTKSEWENLILKKFPEKYILVYDTERNDRLKHVAKRIANRLNLPIYSAGSFPLSYARKNFHHSGPDMFLTLVGNAEYVISNSFHGTAFAMIFHKNFCVVNRSEDINTRMSSLLAILGIENRLVGVDVNIESLINPLDYGKINVSLDAFVKESKNFLRMAINA